MSFSVFAVAAVIIIGLIIFTIRNDHDHFA